MTSLRARLAIAATSLAASGAAGWAVLRHLRPEPDTVAFADHSAEIAERMEARLADGGHAGVPADLAELGRDFARRLREELDEDTARAYSPATRKDQYEYVPGVLFRLRGGIDAWRPFDEHPAGGFRRATNRLGLREDDEPAALAPDLRVLVVGDSHVAGVCANDESLPNRLEARLAAALPGRSVEVWNVAQGGYEPPNYLGVLDTYGGYEPDALVAVVYGGNDFRGVLGLWRYAYRQRGSNEVPWDLKAVRELRGGAGLLGQEIHQLAYFLANPDLEARAADVVAAILVELARQCGERGASFLAVYLPPPSSGQPHLYGDVLRAALEAAGVPAEGLAASERMADRALATLRRLDVPALDLRERFRREERPLYWRTDLHLNVDGHAVAAEEVERALAR